MAVEALEGWITSATWVALEGETWPRWGGWEVSVFMLTVGDCVVCLVGNLLFL